MTFIDWTIAVIIVVSSLISLKRGFVKEALSLVTWIGALIIARMFSGKLAYLLSGWIESDDWRIVAAFAILFAATLIIGAMINHLLGEVIRMTGLTGTDRILGVAFGLLRGVIIVLVILFVLNLVGLQQLWQDALLVKYFDPIIQWVGENYQKASQSLMDMGQQ